MKAVEEAKEIPLVLRAGEEGGETIPLLIEGLDPDRLDRIRAYIDAQVEGPAATAPFMQVLVARNGRVAWQHSAGPRFREEKPAPQPVSGDTIIRIYSMTKPIVSAAAMILVERAQLHLDHPVERYLPCFKDMMVYVGNNGLTAEAIEEKLREETHRAASGGGAGRQRSLLRPAKTKMTVQHLLTHTAGITYNFMPGAVAKLYTKNKVAFIASDVGTAALPPDSEQPGALLKMVEKLAALPLVCDPGTEFHYSNSIDVVGCLIEQVSGKLLGDFLREEIFEPLGMVDTGFHVPPEKVERFAACYALTEAGRRADDGQKEGDPAGGFALTDEPSSSAYLVPRQHLTSGGGGLVSTLDDYAKFVLMMMGGSGSSSGTGGSSSAGSSTGSSTGRRQRVLSRKTIEFMMRNHLEPGVTVPAGFLHAWHGVGFGIGGSVTLDPARNAAIGSENQWSWGGAANTYMNVDRQEDLAFILFTQVTPSFTLCQWRRALQNLVQACLVDPPARL